MNLKDRLRHLAAKSSETRMYGKTTLLAKVAKELGGMILGANHTHARLLSRTFGVPAKSVDLNLEGFSGPFIFDHFALESLFERAADKIEALEKENEELKKQLQKLEYNAKDPFGKVEVGIEEL